MNPVSIQSQQYMILPAPNFRSTSNTNFLISFSGIAQIENFKGNSGSSWHAEILSISDTIMGMDKVLPKVQNLLPPLPAPSPTGALPYYKFLPLQWAINASPCSIFNKNTSVNAGYAVDSYRIHRIGYSERPGSAEKISVMDGIEINIAVSDSDGEIKKVNYAISVYGYFTIIWRGV